MSYSESFIPGRGFRIVHCETNLIRFSVRYPNTPWHYPEFSVDYIEAHWDCEAFVSDLVERQREFSKLNQKHDGFKFEYRALEENWP